MNDNVKRGTVVKVAGPLITADGMGEVQMYDVVQVSEKRLIGEVIEKYRAEAYPAIIPVPDNRGASGVALAALKANVEKAIGADILFNEE